MIEEKKKPSTTQILKALKADKKASEQHRKNWDTTIETYKREYRGEPYGNERKGRSRIVSKDIRKQDEWLHPKLLDPFVSTKDVVKVTPITWEDTESARQSELLLNHQFCRQFDRYNFMSKALKVLSQEGTLVVQCGWEYEEDEVEVQRPVVGLNEFGLEDIVGVEDVIETQVVTNKPTATVCRNEDIFIDPTCMDDMDKCQFVIHRYESDYSTLKGDGRYKNLDKVMRSSEGSSDTEYDFEDEDDTEFRFEDNPRKKLLVHEYWGNYDVDGDGVAEAIVCAWIGDTVIRLQENPYPDGKPPFLVVPFNSVPFQLYGESDAELISDNQKIKTAITRGIIDNMAQSNNGQIGVAKGALDPGNRKKWLAGESFEFNRSPNDFWQGSYNEIPSSAYNMLNLMNNEIESMTAVKSFAGGINGGSLGDTATGARGAIDATSVRVLNRVRNVSENLVKPLMRKWLAYSYELLEEEEVIRITNEEFVTIRRDDLEGRTDLDISVSTSEDNKAKADEITFMLQTQGQQMGDEMQYKMLAQWADLTKQPELAKVYRDWTPPEPDPMEVAAKEAEVRRMQLENKKLEAEIAQMFASVGEDEADRAEKFAAAELKKAQTRKLNSEADLKDMEFLEKDEGVAHKQEMEKKEFDRLSDLDKMVLQRDAGDKNIGV